MAGPGPEEAPLGAALPARGKRWPEEGHCPGLLCADGGWGGWDALEQNYRWWGHCRESEEERQASGTAPVWGSMFFLAVPQVMWDLSSRD